MKIGIATDHNGVNEKVEIINNLKELGYEVIDYSTDNNPLDDYPLFAGRVAKAIQSKEIQEGILMCGTGIGMSIAANKYKGIRCAKVSNLDEARLAKEHNNANIIALSYKEDVDILKRMITIFCESEFLNEERHTRRLKMIEEVENEN